MAVQPLLITELVFVLVLRRLDTVDRVSRLPGLRVLDRFGCQHRLGILGPCPLVHPGLEIHRLCRTVAPSAVGSRLPSARCGAALLALGQRAAGV